jgi:hypothetical protein
VRSIARGYPKAYEASIGKRAGKYAKTACPKVKR